MIHTNIDSGRLSARGLSKLVASLGVALCLIVLSNRAHALVNAGAEVGLFNRTADAPNGMKFGVGYGLHGEVTLLPLILVGPYYLHYELSAGDRPQAGAADAVFNTLGLRARLMLPIPGGVKPFAYVGAGYTAVNYALATGDRGGHFLEIPIGVGLAYQILELFQLSLDAAYRPGSAFGGTAFDQGVKHPTGGFSVILGAALDL